MKLKLLLLTCTINSLFATTPPDIRIIHNDPMDIRRTSLRGGAFYSNPYGSGGYVCLSRYVKPKTKIYYNWQFLTQDAKGSYGSEGYDSDKSPNYYHARTFGIERHVHDEEMGDFIRVEINSRSSLANGASLSESIRVPATKRHVLALTGGITILSGRQICYRESEFNTSNKFLTQVSTNKKINISDQTQKTYAQNIFTRTLITALEMGLKIKRIEAVGIRRKEHGRRWGDIYKEYYLSFIVPVYGQGDEKVYLNNNTKEAYKITSFKTPKPGFRLGFNFRSCITTNLEFGAELGILPSIVQSKNVYLSGRIGVCINAGKLKFIDEAYEAPKLR